MALIPNLELGETLLFEDGIDGDKYVRPVKFAVSNQAIYITKEKHFARESFYLERISLRLIKQIFVERQRPVPIWLFSILLFVGGLILTTIMTLNVINKLPGTRVSGVPFALIVAGILIPILAKGRRIIVVQLQDRIYKWKPQLTVDSKSRNRVKQLQQDFIKSCRSVGIHVAEEK